MSIDVVCQITGLCVILYTTVRATKFLDHFGQLASEFLWTLGDIFDLPLATVFEAASLGCSKARRCGASDWNMTSPKA
ncbi:MAG: hypothetical protein ACLPKT_15160 [Methylocella sp.]